MARLSDEILAACKAEPMLIHTQDAHRIVGTIESLESDLAEARQERDEQIEATGRAECALAEAQAKVAGLVAVVREDQGRLIRLAAKLVTSRHLIRYSEGSRPVRDAVDRADEFDKQVAVEVRKIADSIRKALAEPTQAGEPAGRPEGGKEGQADATT